MKLPDITFRDPLTEKWYKKHGSKYKGLWVAVKAGKKLAKSKSLKRLVAKLSQLDRVSLIHIPVS